MVKRILCDTNVWLDYYIGVRKGHATARRLITQGAREGIDFLVPASSLGDFFYLCQNDFKRVLREAYGEISDAQAAAAQVGAWSNVEHLLELATVVGSDHGDANIALKHRCIHGDFEDDFVIAAALRATPDCLVTSDEQLRRHSPVRTFSPAEAIAFFNLA